MVTASVYPPEHDSSRVSLSALFERQNVSTDTGEFLYHMNSPTTSHTGMALVDKFKVIPCLLSSLCWRSGGEVDEKSSFSYSLENGG